jgi:lysophospholipase L1-like esterase
MRKRTAVAIALALTGLLAGLTLLRAPTPIALPMPPTIEAPEGAPRLGLLPAASVEGLARLTPLVVGPAQVIDGGWRHQWPGLQWRVRFDGTGLRLLFDDPHNRFRLVVDGRPVAILTRPGKQVVELTGLAPGLHEASLIKFSESPAPAWFGGFFLPIGARALPAPDAPTRLIEFIGDSDTVGYASMADGRACTPDTVYLTTDTSATFGPHAAARFGADYRLIARSGIGLVRNYGGADPGRAMATLYPSEDLGPPPQVLVIGLGSNDFAAGLQDGEPWADAAELRADFTRALVTFTRQRHAAAPDARIILLAFNEYGDDIRIAHEDAVAELGREGIATTLIPLSRLGRRACDWHPSQDDHDLIARLLIDAIGRMPDL